MTAVDDYVQYNHARPPAADDHPPEPAHGVAVVTCMDARIDPAAILGLSPGDAHVIRNAGGVVTQDVLRSLSMSQHLLQTDEVMIVQHTQCGMSQLDDDQIRDRIREAAGTRPDFDTHAFSDLLQSLRDAARKIRDSPFLTRTRSVRGFIYDVETGKISEVDVQGSG